jgi:hypothetical protein
MWVRFVADFDFSPSALKGLSTVAYKAGMEKNVTRECADEALAAKKAVRIAPQKRNSDAGGEP